MSGAKFGPRAAICNVLARLDMRSWPLWWCWALSHVRDAFEDGSWAKGQGAKGMEKAARLRRSRLI
jgi:hypothetical protein